MTEGDCLIAGCRWGTPGVGRCECFGTLTDADIAVMRAACSATAPEVDFSEFFLDEDE